jgi:hypothetical protein
MARVAARSPYATPRMANIITKMTAKAKQASIEAGNSTIPHP